MSDLVERLRDGSMPGSLMHEAADEIERLCAPGSGDLLAEVEQVARAIEATMFAPHELPLDAELHAKYRNTAAAAIKAMDQWRFEAAGIQDAEGGSPK